MTCRNPAMQRAMEIGRRCAQTSLPVLLVGERGVGKDWLARQIHGGSSRATGVWSKLQGSAATPDSLADQFHRAYGGTLYLEDIDQTSCAVQAQLRSLVEPLVAAGNNLSEALKAHPRLIASTACDTADLLGRQLIHQELYFLFSPASIYIPPLRERVEDIPEFVEFFLSRAASTITSELKLSLTQESLKKIVRYDWPGNLEQLQSCILRAALLSDGCDLEIDPEIDYAPFGKSRTDSQQSADPVDDRSASQSVVVKSSNNLPIDLSELTRYLVSRGIIEADKARLPLQPFVVDQVEKELIAQVLEQCESVHTKAAIRLGINRNTLHKKVKEYDLG